MLPTKGHLSCRTPQYIGKAISQEIAEADIKHGIIQAGAPFIRYRIQVCSMQTLVRLTSWLSREIIIDDAHHCRSASYMKISTTRPEAKVLA